MSLPYPEWHRDFDESPSQVMMPPNKFWGMITKNGEEVPDGQFVYGVFSTKENSGKDIGLRVRGKCVTERKLFEGKSYNYLFNIPTEGTTSWESGALVEFYLGIEKARETCSLDIAGVTRLDLHIGEAPPPPPPSRKWLLIVGASIVAVVLAIICNRRRK